MILESLGKLAKKNLIRIFEFESSIPRNSISAETLEGLKDKPAALKVVLEAMNAESEEEAGGIGLSAKHQKEANDLEKFVMLVYALNPFSILSCVGKSLSIFTSLATVLSARFATEGTLLKRSQARLSAALTLSSLIRTNYQVLLGSGRGLLSFPVLLLNNTPHSRSVHEGYQEKRKPCCSSAPFPGMHLPNTPS